MGWVYVIAPNESSAVKIGRTGNRSVKGRLADFQVGHPDPLVVLAKVRCRDDKALENQIHDALSRYRVSWAGGRIVRREWFGRTPEVDSFIAILRDVRSHKHLDIYLARLRREMRCDLCHLPISLTAPLEERVRCGGCRDAAWATGERLRAAKAAARARRDAKRDAQLPEMPEGVHYLTVDDASRYLGCRPQMSSAGNWRWLSTVRALQREPGPVVSSRVGRRLG